jgi:hypothetical protein
MEEIVVTRVDQVGGVMGEIVEFARRHKYFVQQFSAYYSYLKDKARLALFYATWVKNHTWVVARSGGRMVGFMSVEHPPQGAKTAYTIAWLCADSACAGAETALLDHAHAMAAGCIELHFDAELDMALLRRLRMHGYGMMRPRCLCPTPDPTKMLDVGAFARMAAEWGVTLPPGGMIKDEDELRFDAELARADAAEAAIDSGVTTMDEFCRQFPEYIGTGPVKTVRMACVLDAGELLPNTLPTTAAAVAAAAAPTTAPPPQSARQRRAACKNYSRRKRK